MRNCLRIFQLICSLSPFFPVILLFFVIRCLIGRGLCFPEIFLIIFHIVFSLVEVLILLIYSCQHFFFVSFIVLRAFALFCLYPMQFLVVGSFLNFLKAAFLYWTAFFAFCVKARFVFFFVRDSVFGDTCFSYSDQSFCEFFYCMDFSFYE